MKSINGRDSYFAKTSWRLVEKGSNVYREIASHRTGRENVTETSEGVSSQVLESWVSQAGTRARSKNGGLTQCGAPPALGEASKRKIKSPHRKTKKTTYCAVHSHVGQKQNTFGSVPMVSPSPELQTNIVLPNYSTVWWTSEWAPPNGKVGNKAKMDGMSPPSPPPYKPEVPGKPVTLTTPIHLINHDYTPNPDAALRASFGVDRLGL